MLSIIQVSLPPPPLPNLYLPISITILFRYFPPYLLICLFFLQSLPNSLYSIINIYTERELIHIDMVDLTIICNIGVDAIFNVAARAIMQCYGLNLKTLLFKHYLVV